MVTFVTIILFYFVFLKAGTHIIVEFQISTSNCHFLYRKINIFSKNKMGLISDSDISCFLAGPMSSCVL